MKKKKYCYVVFQDGEGKYGVKKISIRDAEKIGMIRYDTEVEAYASLYKIKKELNH